MGRQGAAASAVASAVAGAIDVQAEQQAIREALERRATSDGVALRVLGGQLRELEAEGESAAERHADARARLEASEGAAAGLRAEFVALRMQHEEASGEGARELQAALAAKAAEQLYLRNVLVKYMETEDHESMFPVVATLLHLTTSEVEAVARAKDERSRSSLSRRLFG